MAEYFRLRHYPPELLNFDFPLRLSEAIPELEVEDAVGDVFQERDLFFVVRPFEHQDEVDSAVLVDGVNPEQHQVGNFLRGVLVHQIGEIENAPPFFLDSRDKVFRKATQLRWGESVESLPR